MPRPTALVLGLLTLSVVSLPYMTGAGFARADVNDLRSGQGGEHLQLVLDPHRRRDRSLGEDVHVDGRECDLHTNIMPAFYLGVRF